MKEKDGLCSFIGIDLAWSERHPSGLALLTYNGDTAVLSAADCRTSDEDIIGWIEQHGKGPTWLGIDAPIIAPSPEKTARPVDRQVASLFGRFHAGVYPGNRERCARPIRISQKLSLQGYCVDPFCAHSPQRRQLEIFPHLAQVALFGARPIVKYKKGSRAEKCAGLTELQRAIAKSLAALDPPLVSSAELRALLEVAPRELRGKQLKALEDKIDALLCAYMALYFWRWGEEKCQVFGDVVTGYIIGPKIPRVQDGG
ncbi:MAG TPA: DUF429 domain-containing protein [Candidatus Acidoferrales bacterium]|nr:DUF429 domain-containing protein [Candidatus Acidoferrales bacterium]